MLAALLGLIIYAWVHVVSSRFNPFDKRIKPDVAALLSGISPATKKAIKVVLIAYFWCTGIS